MSSHRIAPGDARNIIRRALRTVVDRSPTARDVSALWTHFENSCAYCGAPLERARREGQIDHFVPTSAGGSNHIGNRVLSCGPCNRNEKQNAAGWEFLEQKVLDPTLLRQRRERIESWLASHPHNAVDVVLLERETSRALAAFDTAVSNLRSATRQCANV